jgi:hypothetical protein
MLVWTRWGIAIPFLGYLGFLAGVELAIAIGQQLQTNASRLMASGQTVGALLASLLVMIFEDWRSTRGGEKRSRTLIDEATGERIAADDPGDTFFWLHSRRWIWLMLVVGLVCVTVTLSQRMPLQRF